MVLFWARNSLMIGSTASRQRASSISHNWLLPASRPCMAPQASENRQVVGDSVADAGRGLKNNHALAAGAGSVRYISSSRYPKPEPWIVARSITPSRRRYKYGCTDASDAEASG